MANPKEGDKVLITAEELNSTRRRVPGDKHFGLHEVEHVDQGTGRATLNSEVSGKVTAPVSALWQSSRS